MILSSLSHTRINPEGPLLPEGIKFLYIEGKGLYDIALQNLRGFAVWR